MIVSLKCIMIVSFCIVILSLSTKLCAFESVRNRPERNAYFTGRMSYLDDMQNKLLQYGKVYLTGYGGIGKTQLAKEFSYIHEKKYDLIWWFDLGNKLEVQYESLLIHLSNSPKFNKLLHIKAKDVAASVVVDFTNSLLEKSDCNWLLVFDNVSNNKSMQLPKTTGRKKHIIITTREKQTISGNVLAVTPFTNREAEQFLFKIHPKEKKENIVRLYQVLRNYPLALAQVSKEILMYSTNIDLYFKKRHNFDMKKLSITMSSDITQEYENNYREVLNLTLKDIEQKDRETAKALYMLALLNINFDKKSLQELFGDWIEEKIVTLSKYGVIQTSLYECSQILSIHDIIKDEATKRLNTKGSSYKKEVIQVLVEYCKNFCAKKDFQYFHGLNPDHNHIAALYTFIDIALQNDIIDEEIISAVIIALRLNDRGIYKYTDLALHKRLANKIYDKNLAKISPIKRALLYANFLYSGFIFELEENLLKFEEEYLRLLGIIENSKNYKELFHIHTSMSFLYILLGDFKEATRYIEKAKKNINYSDNIFDLLDYWYIDAWISYELRKIDVGVKALEEYTRLSGTKSLPRVGSLFARDLKIKFMLLQGRKKEAEQEVEKALKDANSYYNDTPASVVGELEYTKTLIYFEKCQYQLAEKQAHHTLNMLVKIFGGDILDITQAHIYIILGKIYEERGNYTLALKEYERALEFYVKKSYGKKNSFYVRIIMKVNTSYYEREQ